MRTFTYQELHAEVCRAANALKAIGISKGDLVALYMPMVPEAAIAMLACARIGAPHSVVFGGFSAEALRDRLSFQGLSTTGLRPIGEGDINRASECLHGQKEIFYFWNLLTQDWRINSVQSNGQHRLFFWWPATEGGEKDRRPSLCHAVEAHQG